MSDTKITIAENANKVIDAMVNHARLTGVQHGIGSPAHIKTTESLLHAMTNLLRLGGEVWRDGALEVYGRTESGMEYGINMHDVTSKNSHGDNVKTPEWSVNS
jgi:hypothetical protein